MLESPRIRSALAAAAGAAVMACCLDACDGQRGSEVLASPTDAATLSASCSSLEACCSSLPVEVATSCARLATESEADECGAELAALVNVGKCLGSADAAGMATSIPDSCPTRDGAATVDDGGADAGAAVACVLLQPCCASSSVPSGEVATCESIEGTGDETQCAALFSDLTASDECGGAGGYAGSGGACPELAQCCASADLPETFIASCQGTVSVGVASTCASTLSSLASGGFCGGTVGDAEGGRAMTPDCATLATCCDEVSFPATTRSTCQHIVAANVDGECLSALDGYVALSDCAE